MSRFYNIEKRLPTLEVSFFLRNLGKDFRKKISIQMLFAKASAKIRVTRERFTKDKIISK